MEFLLANLVSDNTNFFGATSFHVSHDGRYLFVYYAGDDVIRFPLSTPYDISTKSLNPDQTLTDSTLGELNGSLVSWSNDGYHMYVSGSDDDNLQDWQAETPWSLTNIRYGGRVTFDNANLSGGGRGVFWKPDGLKLFIVTTADNIYQYTLTSAWDMSTASYDGSGSISSDVGNPFGLHFSTDGDKADAFGHVILSHSSQLGLDQFHKRAVVTHKDDEDAYLHIISRDAEALTFSVDELKLRHR